MDWLDEKIENMKNRIHNLSLRKALVFYMLVCVLAVIIVTTVTMTFCNRWQEIIWSKYAASDDEYTTSMLVYVKDNSILSDFDYGLLRIIDFFQNWSILIYSVVGIIVFACMFYSMKLKNPLNILREATGKAGNNDLDIMILYESKDELGDLCRSFEQMRRQLVFNNQKMWDMMEEQKRLNAAFAHDLRTPLTVLKGYSDFLAQYVPEGKVNEEKLISTLGLMSNQIERLERYSNIMKEIRSLEEIPLHRAKVAFSGLYDKVKDIATILCNAKNISVTFNNNIPTDLEWLSLDEAVFLEVFENLLSNGLCYANTKLEISLLLTEDCRFLQLGVADDGKGFTQQGLTMAAKPYYTDNENKSEHYGIGLYVCRSLCEKHQGWLSFSNRLKQGAIVTAAFFIVTTDHHE